MVEQLETSVEEVSTKIDVLSEQVEKLPGEIKEGMAELQEQEKNEASSVGDESAQELIELIPDNSQGFIDGLGSFVEALKYDGTAAVLTLPAVSIPAIDGLFPETKLMDEQQIDFEYWVNFMPEVLLIIVRSLFDVAVVIFCFKEFTELIQGLSSGFTAIGKDWYQG